MIGQIAAAIAGSAVSGLLNKSGGSSGGQGTVGPSGEALIRAIQAGHGQAFLRERSLYEIDPAAGDQERAQTARMLTAMQNVADEGDNPFQALFAELWRDMQSAQGTVKSEDMVLPQSSATQKMPILTDFDDYKVVDPKIKKPEKEEEEEVNSFVKSPTTYI